MSGHHVISMVVLCPWSRARLDLDSRGRWIGSVYVLVGLVSVLCIINLASIRDMATLLLKVSFPLLSFQIHFTRPLHLNWRLTHHTGSFAFAILKCAMCVIWAR
jgi:uncharacterized membrane protein YobD (UPF0266 family)